MENGKWKMDFNPDPKNIAIEVAFSRKIVINDPSPLSLNQSQVRIYESHTHLGLILDTKLKFNEHLEDKINYCNRIIGFLKVIFNTTKNVSSDYKAFGRPHLDYADIFYDKPHNESFKDWLEKVRYNAALAITGAIRGASPECIYNELGLEFLADRRWSRKMTFFDKIVKTLSPKYLQSYLLPQVLNQKNE